MSKESQGPCTDMCHSNLPIRQYYHTWELLCGPGVTWLLQMEGTRTPPPMLNPLTIGDLEPIENNGMSHLQPLLMSGLHSAKTRVSYMCEKFGTLDNRWFLDPERLDSNPEWTNQQAVILDELRRCSERQGPYWAVLLLCVAHIHIYGECMYIHMCVHTQIWRRRERVVFTSPFLQFISWVPPCRVITPFSGNARGTHPHRQTPWDLLFS